MLLYHAHTHARTQHCCVCCCKHSYHAGHQTTDGPHQHKHTRRVWTTFLGQSWEKTERVWGITLMKYCKHWKTDGENKQRQTWDEMNFDFARPHWPMSGSLPRGSTWRLWAVAVLYPVSVRKFKKCRVPSIHGSHFISLTNDLKVWSGLIWKSERHKTSSNTLQPKATKEQRLTLI